MSTQKFGFRETHSAQLFLFRLVGCYLLFLLCSTANQLIAAPILSTSPKASALGNAVTAENVGVSSAAYNPATLTQLRTGREGRHQEYKVIYAPFPDYSIEASKPQADRDPYLDRSRGYIFVNDLENSELYNGQDIRDNAWQPKLEKLMYYFPGVDELVVDDSALEHIILPFMTTAYRPKPSSPFIFTMNLLPGGGGAILKREEWMMKENMAAFGIFGLIPTVAYKINDQWSVGGTFSVMRAGAKAALDVRITNVLLPALNEFVGSTCEIGGELLDVCGGSFLGVDGYSSLFHIYFEALDSFNYTYDFGVLWEPNNWFAFGLTYDPGNEFNMKGDGGVLISPQAVEFLTNLNRDSFGLVNTITSGEIVEDYTGKFSVKMPFSKKISAGISMKITPRLKVNIDYHWRNSSELNKAGFTIEEASPKSARGALSIILPLFTHKVDFDNFPKHVYLDESDVGFRFKDVGNFAMGVSYVYSNRLTLRAGYENRGAALTGDIPLGIPTDSLITKGLGFSYLWDKASTLEVTYVNMSLEGEAKADESLLTSINPYFTAISLWAGSDLATSVNANILQIGYSTRF